jgi:hypothetical protein
MLRVKDAAPGFVAPAGDTDADVTEFWLGTMDPWNSGLSVTNPFF